MDAAQVSKRFGCTVEQAQAAFERNARQLQSMANQARRTGRNVNHATEAHLSEGAASFRAKAGI